MTLPVHLNYIHGRPLANASGETFDVRNPATDEVIYQVQVADAAILDAALHSAAEGQRRGTEAAIACFD